MYHSDDICFNFSGKKKLDGFFFNTIFHDPKLRQWTTHIDFVNQWRQLAEKYRLETNALEDL
jgi:hypothetical protein